MRRSRFAREEAGIAAGERIWKRGKVTTEDLVEGRVMTSGKTSGSFTSSSLTVRSGPMGTISNVSLALLSKALSGGMCIYSCGNSMRFEWRKRT